MAPLCLSPAVGGIGPASVAGYAPEVALALGERLYREGLGVDGEPVRATVADDVAVDGSMFSCVNCHRRSGLGSVEGPVVAWPVSGRELLIPRRRAGTWNPEKRGQGPGAAERWSIPRRLQVPDARPAYTDESLARVLRTGIDPAGRVLGRAMPRYDLGQADTEVLIHYLKSLSAHADPGAGEQAIRFATVVTEGVPAADRDAMLAVLRAHIRARNTQTRPYMRRAEAGPFYKTEKNGAYRKLALDVWTLTGTSDTWRAQLEDHYRDRPVFALLGGIAAGSWRPVHEFCEAHRIPALFPLTDRPVVSDTDWYTVYFSKGLYQDGEAAARYLAATAGPEQEVRIVQLYRRAGGGEEAARGFRETWERSGRSGLESRPLAPGETPSPAVWRPAGKDADPLILLLWLDADEFRAALQGGQAVLQQVKAVMSSWSLMRDRLGSIPEAVRDRLYLTYPYSLPDAADKRRRAVEAWLKARHIPSATPGIGEKMYFLGWMLPAMISHLRSELYRDYFLEGLDMMPDQDYAIAVYPRLSFGPDQRYASKGCYITRLTSGADPDLVKVGDWVIN